jgi:hypothetical protein
MYNFIKIKDLILHTTIFKEILTKSYYFRLVKTVRNFPEVRRDRITVTTHFAKFTNSFSFA